MILFAKLIIFIGVSCLIGGGVPQKGFVSLLNEHKKNIANNQKSSLDQQNAYYTFKAYQIGLLLIVSGALFWIFNLLMERN